MSPHSARTATLLAALLWPVLASTTAAQSPSAAPAASPSKPAVIRPADNLVTDGIPEIPAAIAEAVGRYTEFRSAGFAGWHPSRREMLISTRFGDTPQIHEVRMPGGARRQLTFFPDRVGGASWPRRSEDYFLFAKDRGGDEFVQIHRLDVATGTITMISDGGRSQNYPGPWSHQGDRLAFSSTRRNGADRDVYVMDPRDPATARLLLEVKGGGWGPADWSPDDSKLLVSENISVNETYVWSVDVATGAKTLVTAKGGPEKVAYGGPRWSADGKGIYVTTDRDSEFHRLTHVDLATGKHTYLTSHIPWDVEGFEPSPDGKTIAFETNEEGSSVLHLLDTATGEEKPAPKLPVGLFGGLEWHNNGRDLGLAHTSPRSPADAYSVDVATGKVERWTESETGGLNAQAFSEPELVRWKSFDGRTISGFLYKPPARFTGPRPVVVEIHGGPEGQSRPGFQGRDNYLLDELGVAILNPNVRGSTGFGKSFVKLDNGVLREDSVKDVGALLDWIPSRSDLDASRVMVTGGSYGGYMTLAVATHYDAKIRCSLDVVGISNFVTFLQNTEAYRRDLRRVEYGDERDPTMREFLLRIAPANNASKIAKPLFVVQGKNDPRVPWTESEQMVATVKKNGGPVWYLLADDEGHGFAKKKNQDFQFYATVAFMKAHLLN
ncbi:MAG TPA: S9 family peptidase [Vicinamibacteria bacterium]|nr:S9 family peptidase [Vicinamibacteria bacterium]